MEDLNISETDVEISESFNQNDFAMEIFDGIIQNITFSGGTGFVTVTYAECLRCPNRQQTIVLIVNRDTLVLNERGNVIPVSNLRSGMIINASVSSAMTRSIPPQARAFVIRIVRRPSPDNITIGRIINRNDSNRSITTISDGNVSSIIRFNVPPDAVILDIFGRRMNFSRLTPGMRVRVRHASFMTASIPPQTTAFEIRVIG